MEDTNTGLIIGRPKDRTPCGQHMRIVHIVRRDSNRFMERLGEHLDTGCPNEQDYKGTVNPDDLDPA